MNRSRILVVDDEELVRQVLHDQLRDDGHEVTAVGDGPSAIQAVKEIPFHVMITDLQMPSMTGIELLTRVLAMDFRIMGIVMTGHGTIERAVNAMKAGAYDFITKPVRLEVASLAVTKALEAQRLRQENVLLRKTVREPSRTDQMIGTSEAMRAVQEFVEKVADTDSTVLIQGETGTGKELVARLLHRHSLRRDRPLVSVNCGAIPELLLDSELFGHEKGAFTDAVATRLGRFEVAHGGTIFLDEIGEMSPALQVKLLRVLHERCFERVGGTKTIHVDVRVIAATNQDLEQAVRARRFRQDLYYRLHVIPLTTPPLRARRPDIPLLVDHFLNRFNRTKQTAVQGVDTDAMRCLLRYDWPGNIRELENVVERLVTLKKTGCITPADLPETILQRVSTLEATRDAPCAVDGACRCLGDAACQGRIGAADRQLLSGEGIDLVKALDQYETRLILGALQRANGVTSQAAQWLHLNRTTLVEKLKRKGLDPRGQRIPPWDATGGSGA